MGLPEVCVFVGASLDGYIADGNNGLAWLDGVNASGEDYGYDAFLASVDAVLLGRNTYELTRKFPDWPYKDRKVYVLTHRPLEPVKQERAVSGELRPILEDLAGEGARRVYLDGGRAIQAGLKAGLVTGLTVSVVPVLLGGGVPLFGAFGRTLALKNTAARRFNSGLVRLDYEVKSS
ncbi:MAG: hypothetical protein A2X32_02005 [Elusimicrobia bacterium GWC2_64_44]|nr:MAG: hypothetical protein A2X32_02005 [Elusimicrobia bacterium GWC2_64_44]